ncbi:MAG: GGDEF domain-containing protein [Pseudomonadota bacterium]
MLRATITRWLRQHGVASWAPTSSSTYRHTTLSLFCLAVVAVITFTYGLLNWLYFDEPRLAAIELAVSLISTIALADLYRNHNAQRAAWVAVIATGGMVLLYFWYVRAEYSAIVWAALFAMISFVLLGTRRAAPMYLLFVTIVTVTVLLKRHEWPALADRASLANHFGALLAFGILAFYQERARETAHARIQRLAEKDSLTGIANRRHFVEAFDKSRHRLIAQEQAYAFLLLDIDHFKHINDTYGHAIGDEVIIAITRRIAASVRAEDLVGRLGGEEFGVLLVNCSSDDAKARADGIRRAIGETPITIKDQTLTATISIGVASGMASAQDFNTLYVRADEYLYQAKAQGRNRVVADARPWPSSSLAEEHR